MSKVPDDIKQKLLPYQIQHVDNIIYSLNQYNRCLDGSDTGTGKTYSAIATALILNLKPFIICPKSVISSWRNVLKYFDCKYYGISNYELIQNCKYYIGTNNDKIKCPYIKVIEKEIKKDDKQLIIKGGKIIGKTKIKKKTKIEYLYTWDLPKDALIIFDEAHRCKNQTTKTSKIIFTACQKPVKILMLSATIADKSENFEIAGYVLGLYQSLKNAKLWIQSAGKEFDNPMQGVHDEMYPEYASRMRIRDLGKLFPKNQVLAECYDMDNAKEIEEEYKIIEEAVESLKEQEKQTFGLGKIIKARQRIEMLKIPTYLELARQYLDENLAVAIFVNFTQTLRTLADELKTNCVIFGQQTLEERSKNIDDFNNDKSQIIICNIRAGGVGISLHDTKGVYPRISIISPSWSAQDIIQALGRIHRAKGQTAVRQRIIFCKNTIEEKICVNMKGKIENIAAINDGDTLGYQIEGLMTTKLEKDSDMTEFEKLFQRISVLNIKRDRLNADIKEVNDEIKTLELSLSMQI